MSIWRGNDIANAFGITETGLVLHGVYCLNTSLGLATPSLYRGQPDFLRWLGKELPHINLNLGRLGISRLLSAPSGEYYVSIDGENVILSTLETGPSCDPHNAFELFTVAAGLAHVHQVPVGVTALAVPDWLNHYQSQADKLAAIRPTQMSKRSAVVWSNLEETWRLCVEESVNLLAKLQSVPRPRCLTLGLKSFSDFIYLADRHQVHYNSVASCHLGSPTLDLARLILSAPGETRIAHNILLSYQRVRALSLPEIKEFLAHLWFPHEMDTTLWTDETVNPLSLQRITNLAQAKIGMISELEDILLPPPLVEKVEDDIEKEVIALSKEKTSTPTVADISEVGESEQVSEQKLEIVEPEVEKEGVTVDEVSSRDTLTVEQGEANAPVVNLTARNTRPATVWGPFPPPITAEPVTVEEPPTLEAEFIADPEDEEVEELVAKDENDLPLW